jgi:epoxide hydrolase-like predicted phosphatase
MDHSARSESRSIGVGPGRVRAGVAAVVFDYGGVLSLPPFEVLAALERRLGLDTGVLVDEFRTGDAFAEAELGTRAVSDCFTRWRDQFEARNAIRLSAKDVFGALAAAGRPNIETIRLVRELSVRLRLGVLTNNIPENSARWRSAVPIELFETVIDSCEVGLRKPDPAIFGLLLDRMDLAPSQIVFVDDTTENVRAACALGFNGIHFRSAARLRTDLAAIGVH